MARTSVRRPTALQSAREFVEPFIDEWRQRSDSDEAAFRDWAVNQVLVDEDLAWETIQRITEIDGNGDQGIDGWYLAEDQRGWTLSLFQSKRGKLGAPDVSYLHDALDRIYSGSGGRDANEVLRLHAADLKDRSPENLRVDFYWLTYDEATDAVRAAVEGLAEKPLILFGREVPSSATVRDIKDLSAALRIGPNRPINARFEAANCIEHWAGGFKTATFVASGVTLERLFAANRSDLFRHNPRYYLSARTKINKDVMATLMSEERGKFFLFNNGITAIANSIDIDRRGHVVSVSADDFQIVNGCQTTASLYEAWSSRRRGTRGTNGDAVLAGVDVLVRIIENPGQSMAPTISEKTNSQNATKPQDFKSTDRRQQVLQAAFERLRPPWFYEIKRGEWTHRDDKKRFAERHMDKNDLAQACLAFCGEPSDATDRAQSAWGEKYSAIFPDGTPPERLLLAYRLFLVADEVIRPSRKEEPWTQYLRYPVVAVLGRFLREVTGVPDSENYLSTENSQRLLNTLDEWGEPLAKIATAALRNYVLARSKPDEESGNPGIGPRALVRQRKWIEKPYIDFKDRVRERLADQAETARSLGQKADTVGLRSKFPFDIAL